MQLALPILIAVLAGASIVTQQALNNNLRFALDSVVWPGFVSYFVGLMSMVVFAIAMREPIPAFGVMARVPWWAWSGGFFGAVFIAIAIFLVPKLGAATFIALFVAGQLLASLVFDHYGILGLAVRPIDTTKVIGAALLVAGVVLIRR
ncbi:MAG: DMT family transporter [Rhizobiales bacterium]|nr:DMT family transporter [Hyphomicrobiales bacterium]